MMRTKLTCHRLGLSIVVGCVWLLSTVGVCRADGTQTGVVAGQVVDTDGGLLPGVQIELDGAGDRRSAVTDGAGRFRFPALRPGTYAVTANLLSLRAEASGVVVYIGRTTPVTLRLGEALDTDPAVGGDVFPGPSESVQVVALAPLVDPFDTRVRSVVRREFLDVLPVERFYQSVALLLPDVAGGDDGNPNVGGALRSNNLFLVDGVDTTDPVTGLFGLNLAYEAVESVEVLTAGLPAELGRVSGSVINVVTRSSGDAHRGTVYWQVEPGSAKGDYRQRPGPPNLDAEIAAFNGGSEDDQSVAATLGGPLLGDGEAWYFVAGSDADSTQMRPTLIGDVWNGGVAIDAGVARLGWRIAESHTAEVQYTLDSASSLAFSPLLINAENTVSKPPTSAFSALTVPTPGNLPAVSLLEQDGSFVKLDWGSVLGPAWTANATLSMQDRELTRSPGSLGSVTGGATHADITSLAEGTVDIFDEVAFWNGVSDVGRELRPREQASLSAGWFAAGERVDHDLRFGFDLQDIESDTDLRVSGAQGFDRETGEAVAGQFFFDLGADEVCFAGGPCQSFDPVNGTFGPFILLNMPERPPVVSESKQWAIYLSDAITAGRWLVDLGLRWERQEATSAGRRLFDHQALAPRLGVKYDARGDGSTLYSLHVGRYIEPLPQGFLDSFLRPDFFSGATVYFWEDFFLDPACSDPSQLDAPCWVFDGQFTPGTLQASELDPDLRRTHMDEVVFGFERRLGPTLGLQLHWVQRQWAELWDDVIFADDRGDVVRNIDEAERRHRALRVLVQKRFADGWQLLASITRSRTEGNLFTRQGDATFFDFRDLSDANQINRFGPAPYDRPTQLRVFALYELPVPRARLTLGTAFSYETGTPWQATREDFDVGAVVFLDLRGSRRLEDVVQWDLSLTAAIDTATDLEILAKLDVFNVLDEQSQIGVESDVALPGFGQPRGLLDIQAPRRWRVSIELRF